MERNTRDIEIGYGIPTYNRYDLLQSNLLLYARDFGLAQEHDNFYIVDNGNQNIGFTYGTILRQENNIGVGASWNIICDRVFKKCTHAVILNDDIYLGLNTHVIKRIIERIYLASQSLEKDPSILESSKKNKKLYIEMWGGEPEREKYKTPFNK